MGCRREKKGRFTMAFCKYCGSPLAEGQICGCPQAQAEAQAAGAVPTPPPAAPQQVPPQQVPPQQVPPQQPVYQQAPQQQVPPQYQQPNPNYQYPPQQPPKQPGENPFSVIGPFIKDYFKAPVAACQKLTQNKKFAASLVMMAIQAVVCGLMFFFLLNKMLTSEFELLGQTVFDMEGSGLGAPFFLCLVAGFVMSALSNAAYALVIFCLAKIGKSSCSYVDALTFWGGHSPLVVAGQLLSIILCLLNLGLGLVCMILCGALTWVLLVYTTDSLVPGSGNKIAIVILTVVFAIVAAFVVGWLSSTIFAKPISDEIVRSVYSRW